MGLTKLALKFAAPVPQIEDYDRYLFIGPHPDDIEIGAGATAAKLAAAGKKVCFLICIDGRYGDGNVPKDMSREELIQLRKKEARHSARVLGVSDVRFLGFCDGGYYEQEELLKKVAEVISDFQPDVIFAPDPDVASECHIDHINVGQIAKRLACLGPYPGVMGHLNVNAAPVKALALYMTARPNRYVDTAGYLKKQLQAIFCCHLSQFPKDSEDGNSIQLYLKLRSFEFGLRSFHKCAEGFRVLGPTQMHCLPEAD